MIVTPLLGLLAFAFSALLTLVLPQSTRPHHPLAAEVDNQPQSFTYITYVYIEACMCASIGCLILHLSWSTSKHPGDIVA